jgi:DNA ligase-associated metallophosphoesterase
VVSDLHLGKANRIARREGRLTPPYETMETLTRLADVLEEFRPRTVICLGDSFDDDHAASQISQDERAAIAALMAGRRWIWIAGNHDPAPTELGGSHLFEHSIGELVFRHVAQQDAVGEISGHYHPKVRMRGRRPCFLADQNRVIMPAFGVYTGGLTVADPVFDDLFSPHALALMTGRSVTPAPRQAFVGG